MCKITDASSDGIVFALVSGAVSVSSPRSLSMTLKLRDPVLMTGSKIDCTECRVLTVVSIEGLQTQSMTSPAAAIPGTSGIKKNDSPQTTTT